MIDKEKITYFHKYDADEKLVLNHGYHEAKIPA